MIVWLASYPRSGNTFLRVLFRHVFGIETYSVYNDLLDIGSDGDISAVTGHRPLPERCDFDTLRTGRKHYLIKTHELPGNYLHPEDKVIYLYRDGRESTLSYFHYHKDFRGIETSLERLISSGEWGAHLLAWSPHERKRTLTLRFEALTEDPVSHLETIARFLELEPVSKTIPSFEALKRTNPKFFRSGKKDSWKEIYSARLHRLFWEVNYDAMCYAGYTDNMPETFAKRYDRLRTPIEHPPTVSVVTVVRNAASQIRRTLESVFSQTYDSYEYIVIDGASTDGTKEILYGYNAQIDTFVCEADTGIYDAMNKAIKYCRGEWVVFMNAGDRFAEKTTLDILMHYADDKVDILYGDHYEVDGERYRYVRAGAVENIYRHMPFSHQATAIRRTMIERLGFDMRYDLSADYDMFIRAYKSGARFSHVPHPVAFFYMDGLSNERRLQSYAESLTVLSRHTDTETVLKSRYYAWTCTLESKTHPVIEIEISQTPDTVDFTVIYSTEITMQYAFYLYNEQDRVDIRWYDENATYRFSKKRFGKGRYRIRYFIVPADENDPGKAEKYAIGYSDWVRID